MAKRKITKLTDEQYYQYIMSLKDDGAPCVKDGETVTAESPVKPDENKKSE